MNSNTTGWASLVNKKVHITKTIATILYPGNCEFLINAVSRKLNERTSEDKELEKFISTVVAICRTAPKASVQGKVVRASIIKGLSWKSLKELCSFYKLNSIGVESARRA